MEYLRRPEGRPRIIVVDERTSFPFVDPWLSYYVYYSATGMPTGLAEYDELASDIKSVVLENPKKFSRKVEEITRRYNSKHT